VLADARVINLAANVLILLAVSSLLAGGVVWISQRPYFAITRLSIEPVGGGGLQFVSAAGVQATLADRLRGNFFFINLEHVRELMETTPWVRKARVKRVWPNTLQVQLEEHQPLAFWNEDQMLNTWGEPFAANLGELPDDRKLPQLNGPDASERLVVQRYAELIRWIAPLEVDVREITLSPRYAWEVRLNNGVRLALGRDPAADAADPHGRSGALTFASRIERFVQAWPALMARLDGRTLASADLRYPNGFAISLAPVSKQ